MFKRADYDATIVSHDLDIYARPYYYFNYHNSGYNAFYQRYATAIDAKE